MKTLLCRCEDVTQEDIEHALALGYRTIEEVKRYTGLGTGPCQGKECMAQAARLCGQHDPALAQPFTARTPTTPISFAELAGAEE